MPRRPAGAAWLKIITVHAAAVAAMMLLATSPASAANDRVQITNLSDLTFGSLSNAGVDSTRSENVCIYSSTPTNGYNVRAFGSEAGNAFALANGAASLAYEVQWSQTSGQTSGTNLIANSTLSGLISTAKNATCTTSPTTTASLIVVIRGTAAAAAPGGDYSGTLTLVFGPE